MDRKMISRIVKASGISAGEMVLIHFWGEDADKEIANNFIIAVAELGATPVLLQQSRSVNRDIFLAAKESCFGFTLQLAQIICSAGQTRLRITLILSVMEQSSYNRRATI